MWANILALVIPSSGYTSYKNINNLAPIEQHLTIRQEYDSSKNTLQQLQYKTEDYIKTIQTQVSNSLIGINAFNNI